MDYDAWILDLYHLATRLMNDSGVVYRNPDFCKKCFADGLTPREALDRMGI